MSEYNKPRFQPKPFGSKTFPSRDGRDRRPRQMFKANCAKCGNTCDVPFRPNGTKPVYCSNCYVRDASTENHRDRRDVSPRPDQAFNDLKAELRLVNQNLERLITLMTPAVPVPKVLKVSKKKTK